MPKAFTLIELLVVVAIIALLLSILVPSFYNIKTLVWQNTCQTNHYTMVRGVVAYAADYQGYCMNANWNSPWVGVGWLYDTQEVNRSNWNPEVIRNGLMIRYAGEGVLRCPTDEDPRFRARYGSNNLTSYLMNGAVMSYGGPGNQNTIPNKLGEFEAWDIEFWECDPDYGRYWNDGSSNPTEGHTTRHTEGLTVGCFGGNTAWFTEEEYYYHVERKPGRFWCNPDAEDGTFCR